MDKPKSIGTPERKETNAHETDAAANPAIRPWINPEFDQTSLKGALSGGGIFPTDGGSNIS